MLRYVKLIAEPWDASMDGYLVGSFPPPWVEWNDRYRDTVRDFWRGRPAASASIASRLAGSSDLYADDGRSPYSSVNFVTAHDGFTLRDLVSYDHKHNEANGEHNRDGTDNNRSWNCGVEGETDDAEIVALRHRQAANLMADAAACPAARRCSPPATSAAAPSAATTTPTCRTTRCPGSTGGPTTRGSTSTSSPRRRCGCAASTRRCGSGTTSTARPTIEGGPKDLAWLHPSGREMTRKDWDDDDLHVVGMFLSGDPLRSPGPRGEQQRDASFLLWLNSEDEPVDVTLPENEWVHTGEVVLSTDPDLKAGTPVQDGDTSLAARTSRDASTWLLRAETWAAWHARSLQACGSRPTSATSGGQGDDAELGGRGEQVVLRDDAHGVAERAGLVEHDRAVEPVPAALVALGDLELLDRGLDEAVVARRPRRARAGPRRRRATARRATRTRARSGGCRPRARRRHRGSRRARPGRRASRRGPAPSTPRARRRPGSRR